MAKYVEFDARTDKEGITTGYMAFNDTTKLIHQDVDGTGDEGDPPTEFYLKADFDCMTIEKNRSVMSGTVRDSSYRSYIGGRVLLFVEDGTPIREVDKLTWGVYKPTSGGWIPTDYEVKGDDGAFMRWWATDAERRDDVGIPSRNLLTTEVMRCESFVFPAYAFLDIKNGEGNIQVIP
ncbi:MAG TPA: hypothetical protein VNA19_07955 [Pyrinomonadaceae bacterium]|nr:hypothetical protein [Pyrinomonadaceae bacterium]